MRYSGTDKTRPAAQAAGPDEPLFILLSPTCHACTATSVDLARLNLLDVVPKIYVLGKHPEAEEIRSTLRVGAYPFMLVRGASGPRGVYGQQPIIETVKKWAGR